VTLEISKFHCEFVSPSSLSLSLSRKKLRLGFRDFEANFSKNRRETHHQETIENCAEEGEEEETLQRQQPQQTRDGYLEKNNNRRSRSTRRRRRRRRRSSPLRDPTQQLFRTSVANTTQHKKQTIVRRKFGNTLGN
jgi:hypothetical protein